jgi:hypothetical protein
MPNVDLHLVAKWQANNFELKINHYKMNLSGSYEAAATLTETVATVIDADLT